MGRVDEKFFKKTHDQNGVKNFGQIVGLHGKKCPKRRRFRTSLMIPLMFGAKGRTVSDKFFSYLGGSVRNGEHFRQIPVDSVFSVRCYFHFRQSWLFLQ